MKVMVEVSLGELVDKITILRIKLRNIKDESKLVHVRRELTSLEGTLGLLDLGDVTGVLALDAVNTELWEVEDQLRELEKKKDFGPVFVALARDVYQYNDERAAIKRDINEIYGSDLVEVKSYAGQEE